MKILFYSTTVLRKFLGLFVYWLVVPFRAYARSVVHNYALDKSNPVYIRRLNERKPEWIAQRNGWVLHDVHYVGYDGFVKHRKVSAIEFWLVVFLLWGWVDDDSNEDTYSAGHCSRYTEVGHVNGDLTKSIMGRLFKKQFVKAIDESTYGNSFDLGDMRAEQPCFNFIAALVWNTRNTAYNFYYLFWEK